MEVVGELTARRKSAAAAGRTARAAPVIRPLRLVPNLDRISSLPARPCRGEYNSGRAPCAIRLRRLMIGTAHRTRSRMLPDASAPDPRTMACLERLIGFDTVFRNPNRDCIDWARAHLERHGARTRLDWSAERTKANLFATFGEGPGGLVLSGHTDVVPVDGQPWSSDPFALRIADGRAYGRGACDMKGFLAVALGHAPDYAAAPLREPTGMRVVQAHKGGRIHRCRVRGKAAHSSLTPTAVNAVQVAARIVALIDGIGRREQQTGLRDEGFDVPFTTISTNLFSGGNGPNIVPAEAE